MSGSTNNQPIGPTTKGFIYVDDVAIYQSQNISKIKEHLTQHNP